MKLIIAGSRAFNISVSELDCIIMQSGLKIDDITQIVSGTARGIDLLGEDWAKVRGKFIKRFPADWDKFGKSAGYRRNIEMAEYADCLLAIWDGKSKGTKHMIDIAKSKGLKVYIHEISS